MEVGATFSLSLRTHGAAPIPEERFRQEEALYGFFSAGFSVFESACYGLFAVGAFLQPTYFPLTTAKEQQQVSPTRARDAYVKAFPTDPIIGAFAALFADSAYQGLREIRNVLTHRTAPGRRMYASLGSEDAPATEWKLNNVRLDGALAPEREKDVARMLDQLMTAIAAFTSRHLT